LFLQTGIAFPFLLPDKQNRLGDVKFLPKKGEGIGNRQGSLLKKGGELLQPAAIGIEPAAIGIAIASVLSRFAAERGKKGCPRGSSSGRHLGKGPRGFYRRADRW